MESKSTAKLFLGKEAENDSQKIVKSIKCPKCAKYFLRHKSLQRHLRVFHKEPSAPDAVKVEKSAPSAKRPRMDEKTDPVLPAKKPRFDDKAVLRKQFDGGRFGQSGVKKMVKQRILDKDWDTDLRTVWLMLYDLLWQMFQQD